MTLILDILYIYMLIYAVFFVYLTLKSLRNKKFKRMQKYINVVNKKNLCLIIYTHNNEKKLKRMLDCLKKQDYPYENTSIFVILDNCTDNSEKIEFAPNIQKVIMNQGTVGRRQAISILVERIREYSVIDAFVFLNINRYIEEDYLSTVNLSLEDYGVVSGATVLFGEDLSIRQKIKAAYQKYKMNFLEHSRACADFYSIIDSNNCAINRALVEKIGLPDFENLEKDLEYSMSVAREKCTFTFNPNIKTYCEVHDFKIRIPRMSKRTKLFFEHLTEMFSINNKFTEFALYLLCPNVVFVIIALSMLAFMPLEYCFIADFSVVIGTICALIISFALSLINSKMRTREICFLTLYPIYSFFHFLKHFFMWRSIRIWLTKKKEVKPPEETFEIDTYVTDGQGVVPCKLILVNDCGMSKVRFIFKNKKTTTKPHLRTFDALDELINKLAERGLTIQICQACANFSINRDGSTNLIKGYCKSQFQVNESGALPVMSWNGCRGFIPKIIVKNFKI